MIGQNRSGSSSSTYLILMMQRLKLKRDAMRRDGIGRVTKIVTRAGCGGCKAR